MDHDPLSYHLSTWKTMFMWVYVQEAWGPKQLLMFFLLDLRMVPSFKIGSQVRKTIFLSWDWQYLEGNWCYVGIASLLPTLNSDPSVNTLDTKRFSKPTGSLNFVCLFGLRPWFKVISIHKSKNPRQRHPCFYVQDFDGLFISQLERS